MYFLMKPSMFSKYGMKIWSFFCTLVILCLEECFIANTLELIHSSMVFTIYSESLWCCSRLEMLLLAGTMMFGVWMGWTDVVAIENISCKVSAFLLLFIHRSSSLIYLPKMYEDFLVKSKTGFVVSMAKQPLNLLSTYFCCCLSCLFLIILTLLALVAAYSSDTCSIYLKRGSWFYIKVIINLFIIILNLTRTKHSS